MSEIEVCKSVYLPVRVKQPRAERSSVNGKRRKGHKRDVTAERHRIRYGKEAGRHDGIGL